MLYFIKTPTRVEILCVGEWQIEVGTIFGWFSILIVSIKTNPIVRFSTYVSDDGFNWINCFKLVEKVVGSRGDSRYLNFCVTLSGGSK